MNMDRNNRTERKTSVKISERQGPAMKAPGKAKVKP